MSANDYMRRAEDLRDEINRDRGLTALDAVALLSHIGEVYEEDIEAFLCDSDDTRHDVRMHEVPGLDI